MSWLHRLVDFFAASQRLAGNAGSRRRAYLVVACSLAGSVVCFGFAATYFVVFPQPVALWGIAAVASLVLLAIPFVLRVTGSAFIAGNLLTVTALATLCSYAWLRGGFVPRILMWLAVVPIFASLAERRRALTWSWTAIAIAIVLGSLWLWPEPPSQTVGAPYAHALDAGAIIALILFMFVAARTYETTLRQSSREQLRMMEQLQQTQRLESIGQLAGGVAHDFNNLLSVITNYTDVMLDELPMDSPHRDEITQIRGAARRGAGLTRQLLQFSRRDAAQTEALDLNEIVRDMQQLLRRTIHEHVELEVEHAEALRSVRANRGQLEQVLVNLVVNARDAMPEGGRLSIETRDVVLDARYAATHVGVTPGPYVCVRVSDTGHGMSPEIKARAFEPFFTTKDPTRGTGLGLATAYGIVKRAGGNIWIYSEAGKGTTVKIYLPAVDDAPRARTKSTRGVDLAAHSDATVLIAEDDPGVRRSTARVLRRNGFRVLTAENAEQALEIGLQHRGGIDLLLTDVIMPDIAGPELASRMQELNGNLCVVFMSGYTADFLDRQGALDKGHALVEKPFAEATLLQALREALATRRGSNQQSA